MRISRCTGPSGTARIATWCSRAACRTPSRTAWNSRWTCATRSQNDEFFLAYQPTIDLSDMSPTGVEALIRWKHPVRGDRATRRLHPAARGDGLITEVGKWVLEEACAQGAAWRAAGYPIGMAVNVSGRQLDSDQLIADVEGALADSGLDPRR